MALDVMEVFEQYNIKDFDYENRSVELRRLLEDFNKEDLVEILSMALAPSLEDARTNYNINHFLT